VGHGVNNGYKPPHMRAAWCAFGKPEADNAVQAEQATWHAW
jgi:hypothetical protein